MYKLAVGFLVGVSSLFWGVGQTHAASLYLDSGTTSLRQGDTIMLAVRLKVDERASECINTASVVLRYPSELEPIDTSVGESILNLWLSQPAIDTKDRLITFAGGITNGYCGRVEGDPKLTNKLAEISFRYPYTVQETTEARQVAVNFIEDETVVLLNSDQGEPAELTLSGTFLTLEAGKNTEVANDEWLQRVSDDDIPPEKFSLTLVDDGEVYGGKIYITFSTTDKQTGLSHYEIMEEPISKFGSFSWGETGQPWITVPSDTISYILKDQTLNSIIRVKAIDKAGNETLATLIPNEEALSDNIEKNSGIWWLLVLVIVVLLLIFFWRKRKNIPKVDELENDDNQEAENANFRDYLQLHKNDAPDEIDLELEATEDDFRVDQVSTKHIASLDEDGVFGEEDRQK